MALDEGWPERMAGFAPWTAPGPDRTGAWQVSPVSRLGSSAQGHAETALPLLACPVRR